MTDLLDEVRAAEADALARELKASCAGRWAEADEAWGEYVGLGRVRMALADLERMERTDA